MNKILEKALLMRQNSYAPHSHFKVGAALITDTGVIIGGCNVESDVYGLTMCAERNAIFAAFAQGYRHFQAIAVATTTQGTPCGSCRQIIAELCGNIAIYITDLNNNVTTYHAYDLLPHHFTLTNALMSHEKIHEISI
jgi:homotetrameric cytidine deaminase